MQTELAKVLLTKYGKNNVPVLRAGDTVKVYQRIKEGDKERVQIFEGLVIAVKHGSGLDATFTVRKIAVGGIGVERTYPLHSPNVVRVDRVKTADVNRSKLYYMRDRLGKSARFKSETRNPMTWEERPIVAEEIIEEIPEDVIAEEEVIAAVEDATPIAVEDVPADDVEPTIAHSETEAVAEEVAAEPETKEEA